MDVEKFHNNIKDLKHLGANDIKMCLSDRVRDEQDDGLFYDES